MKFTIARTRFLECLKTVQNVANGKTTYPILQNVLLTAADGRLTMMTTDLDISIKCSVECEIAENGCTTLPVKFLFNSFSKLAEGNVDVSVDENDCATIHSGFANFRISGMSEKDFPRLPAEEGCDEYTIPQQTLKEMLRKTSYASSQDDTRRTLKGVLMSFQNGKLTMVATDGRRLAMVENELEFPAESEKDIVLPSKTVQELSRSLSGEGNVAVKVHNTQVCFTMGETSIYSKLIEDKYPNYLQVIPRESAQQITVDRQLLLNAIDRASVMTMDESHSTKLTFQDNVLIVKSAASEIGEAKDEVPIKYAGETIDIMFNPQYVMDPLKVIDDDEVVINLNNGHSPAVIKCSIPFLYVLMPLRTN